MHRDHPSETSGSPLPFLIESCLGTRRTSTLLELLDVPKLERPNRDDAVSRAEFSFALACVLFDRICERVPLAAAYVGDAARRGREILFDHGAVRTVIAAGGALPPGRHAIARLLEPLGYAHTGTYPLPDLGMTGFIYTHRDAPEAIPQYFVSELDPTRFSQRFREAVARVVGTSRDPLARWAESALAHGAAHGQFEREAAARLLAALAACFDRQHDVPTLNDYELLRAESAEMAWIATEGNAFNHATDRVEDVAATAAAQRALGRSIKPTIEVSKSGRVRQTAFAAATVERLFESDCGDLVVRSVPGSFWEFISRDRLPDGSLDLAFDASNAQGIFKMTDTGIAPGSAR